MKKLIPLVLALFMLLGMTALASAEGEEGFTLYYPSYMQEAEGETLVLDKVPERIVCLSNSALQILVRCDIHPIAVTTLVANGEHPDWVYELPTITTGMSGMDIEGIIALEPDLLIVGSYQKEAYAEQLAAAEIPVYYTSEGPSIAYDETREEAITLARSFGGDELAAQIEAEFEEVEARMAAYTEEHDSQSMLIFFYTPGSYVQTSQAYLGSILRHLPFENLADAVFDISLRNVNTDAETIIEMDPEIIFAISPASDADAVREQDEAVFAENPELWNSMKAIAGGNIVYLGREYVSSKGLQIINSINDLLDLLEEKENGGDSAITIGYPENMQALGYTEPVVLEKTPERVVSMSTSPVLALNKMGVHMIAVPASSVVTWPENMADAQLLQLAHNTNFDIETVVALEPDLVILGYTSADTYGAVLTEAGVPVYYVDAGHTVSYDSIKAQTVALIEAFGKGSEAGEEMTRAFSELEEKLDEARAKLEGKTVMVLQSSPPAHYIQTNGGTLGSMAEMIGLTNVHESMAPMAQIDYETALDLHPDLVLAVGMSPTGEGHKALMEEDFANNSEYWNSIEAIANGDILYLPVYFISSAGINVVDHINELVDLVLNHFGL